MSGYPNNDRNDIHIDRKLFLIVLITFCVFLVSAVTLSVLVVLDVVDNDSGYSDRLPDSDKDEDNDSGGDNGNTDTPTSTPSGVGLKTGITLPCATPDRTYLSAPSENTKDVSNDTDIGSAAIVLTDITDNKVVAGKNADTKIYPASMTKVMTLLVACENAKDPNAVLTLTKEMIAKYNSAGNQGASLAFEWQEGYGITVEDALHMVIYGSDTYACWLIADHVAGSEAEFVAMMNAKASELGLTGTHFTNCTGIYNVEHYTTVREMAAIMAAAMNNTTATSVLMKKDYYKVDIHVNGEKTHEMGMWSAWYTARLEAYTYPSTAPYYAGKGSDIRIIGGKTGYESIPTNCFVTAGLDEVTGKRYVCVQVGRIDKTQGSVNSSASTYDTREMYWKYAKEE